MCVYRVGAVLADIVWVMLAAWSSRTRAVAGSGGTRGIASSYSGRNGKIGRLRVMELTGACSLSPRRNAVNPGRGGPRDGPGVTVDGRPSG